MKKKKKTTKAKKLTVGMVYSLPCGLPITVASIDKGFQVAGVRVPKGAYGIVELSETIYISVSRKSIKPLKQLLTRLEATLKHGRRKSD